MFEFNGKRADDASLGILKQTIRLIFPLLPDDRDKTLEIAGLDGAFDFGRDLQPRIIRAQFLVRRDTSAELFQYARAVAAWLNVPESKKFIYDREPDKFYMVRPQGGVSFDKILANAGFCDVTFIAHDPYAYALESKLATTFPAVNEGTVPCPVFITATMDEATTSLKITLFETGEYIELDRELEVGDSIQIDTAQRTVHVNGADARDSVTIRSRPGLLLPVGNFTLTANPASTIISAEYRERWI